LVSKLGVALRKKYKTPREAIKALGLDESLLDVPRLAFDGAKDMKPTRLEFLVTTRAASAINPLLMAMDSKGKPVTVDYGAMFKGLTTKNLKARKSVIMDALKKALKGKTIAKDASMEHVAHMLDQLEHVSEPKSLDESVSGEQHKAMEAAAHGQSNIGIPANVGEEFSRADAGKSFDKMVRDWMAAKDWTGGMSDDDVEALKKMHEDAMPENALDESEEKKEAEDEEETDKKAEDETAEEAEDEEEADKDKAAKDKSAKDKAAKDAKDKAAKDKAGAMDTKIKPITQDQVNKAVEVGVAAERKRNQATMAAREFVKPFIGDVSMALDSEETILRAAAKALNIEDADTIHVSALKPLIKTIGSVTSRDTAFDHQAHDSAIDDGASPDSFDEMFGANRISQVA
jgi:hypothetical protein